jgi:hypothetical protein
LLAFRVTQMNGGGDAHGPILLGEQRILTRDNKSSYL